MLIYLFFIPFALASFPSPNVTGVTIPIPYNVGDSAICLNCINFSKLDLPANWTCYTFQNNVCTSEIIGNDEYNNCSAGLINSTYPQYTTQCQVYVYEVNSSNDTGTSCTENGNLTKCVELVIPNKMNEMNANWMLLIFMISFALVLV